MVEVWRHFVVKVKEGCKRCPVVNELCPRGRTTLQDEVNLFQKSGLDWSYLRISKKITSGSKENPVYAE